jgi:hypothetical protein
MSRQGTSREDLDAGWVSGHATEQQMVHPGGVLEFAVGQSNATVAIGLASEDTNKPFSGMDHAFLFRDDGTVQIYERGIAVSTPRPYVTGNIFSLRVAVAGGLHVVSYVQNNEEIHATRDVAPRFPLRARLLFSAKPAAIIKPTITSFSSPELDAIAPEEVAGGYLELSRVGKPIDPLREVGYNIYRSTDPNLPKKQWQRLNPVLLSETQFTDTNAKEPGVRYYYYVTSVNAYGVESPPSEVMTADPAT